VARRTLVWAPRRFVACVASIQIGKAVRIRKVARLRLNAQLLSLEPAKRSALLQRKLAQSASQDEVNRPWHEQIAISHGGPE